MSPKELLEAERRHQWHPFTQMQLWNAADHEPLTIERGEGPYLIDSYGRRYLDGNSSIWTNIHGHNHPVINQAIQEQLGKIAHSSFLGLTHRPAIELGEKLAEQLAGAPLPRVFFSDDGSTAIECALKMSLQHWQLTGDPARNEMLAFDQAYHGDTLGAGALGGIAAFHDRFATLGLTTHRVAGLQQLDEIPAATRQRLAAVIIEPMIQGAAGMRTWPAGMLTSLRQWCSEHGIHLILDEVMTGFGRTGRMFACQHENVVPDFLCLAKGLSGGYLPLAATLTTEAIFEAFLGGTERTFYHGHSYTGNPLGCAAALANLRLFEEEDTLARLGPRIEHLHDVLASLRSEHPQVSAIRQCGFIAGIDLTGADGTPLDPSLLTGARVCTAARAHGLLTRPIRDTLVLMPPLCTTCDQIDAAVAALSGAISEIIPS
jgi:adenosylmethionine-8-amino-7-oxononanoate aminotransferase